MSEKWAKRGGAYYREKLKKQAKTQEVFRKELERKPMSTRAARALVSLSRGSYNTSKALLREIQKERRAKRGSRRSRKT